MLNNPKRFQLNWGGKTIEIETGRVAKQANGSVLVRMGDTIVLVTATAASSANEPQPFVPLTVNYQEQQYAAGKIPGGFFKREGRPSEKEILVSRLIDRPIRPLFPEGYFYETQVMATVISADGVHDSDILAIVGASAALSISDIPFLGPIAGVKVAYKNGQFVLNPTHQELDQVALEAVIVCTEDSVVMVEGGARFVAEDILVGALEFALEQTKPMIALQKQMMREVGQPKITLTDVQFVDQTLISTIESRFGAALRGALATKEKHARYEQIAFVEQEVLATLTKENPDTDQSDSIRTAFAEFKKKTVRELIRTQNMRLDGRNTTTVRPIEIEPSFLPRSHGSVLFTRGETQAIVTATLGTGDDEQKIDHLEKEVWKRFYLHYNFPPYSVGEVRPLRSPGRREIGHGALAERAIVPTLPEAEAFPYTIRIVSDITESNGSSSMASVCGASLALMDAGVPVKAPIAGVAMGLIQEGEEFIILTDILGDEDHLGDMDFKIAGSREGITSFQMDIKVTGLNRGVLVKALNQALAARLHILDQMDLALAAPRPQLSSFAPKIMTIRIPTDKIGTVIGPGGKVIRGIIAETGAKIDIDDDGLVHIFSIDQQGATQAQRQIELLTKDVEKGEYYPAVVKKIVDFGAFVEILPGVEGLVHISEIAPERIQSVTDVLAEGDRFPVYVIDVDKQGKIRLSRKQALDKRIDDDGRVI